jgi:hypothetical protein
MDSELVLFAQVSHQHGYVVKQTEASAVVSASMVLAAV